MNKLCNEKKYLLLKNGLTPGHWRFLEEDKREVVFVSIRSGRRKTLKKER